MSNTATQMTASEKRRVRAAQRVLETNGGREVYRGYLKLSDDEIMITNGYMVYIGSPIDDVAETKYPQRFKDLRVMLNSYSFEGSDLPVDYKALKRQWRVAKAKKIPYDRRCLCSYVEEATFITTNSVGVNVYLNLERVLMACELVGEKDITISVCSQSDANVAPIIVAGEYGRCYVMPYRKQSHD